MKYINLINNYKLYASILDNTLDLKENIIIVEGKTIEELIVNLDDDTQNRIKELI